jgi:hypothetical protein
MAQSRFLTSSSKRSPEATSRQQNKRKSRSTAKIAKTEKEENDTTVKRNPASAAHDKSAARRLNTPITTPTTPITSVNESDEKESDDVQRVLERLVEV